MRDDGPPHSSAAHPQPLGHQAPIDRDSADATATARRRLDRTVLILVPLMLAASAVAYSALPAQVATHWGSDGMANGWTPRLPAVLVMPAFVLATWALLRAAPRIDPRNATYPKFAGSYAVIGVAVLLMLAAGHAMILAVGVGWHVPVVRLGALSIGALTLVLGNVMPRLQPNYFIGVRTPWTLASDPVWARTHRVGGYLLVGAGIVAVVAGLIGGAYALSIAAGALIGVLLVTVCYSYVAWRAEVTHSSTRSGSRP